MWYCCGQSYQEKCKCVGFICQSSTVTKFSHQYTNNFHLVVWLRLFNFYLLLFNCSNFILFFWHWWVKFLVRKWVGTLHQPTFHLYLIVTRDYRIWLTVQGVVLIFPFGSSSAASTDVYSFDIQLDKIGSRLGFHKSFEW